MDKLGVFKVTATVTATAKTEIIVYAESLKDANEMVDAGELQQGDDSNWELNDPDEFMNNAELEIDDIEGEVTEIK